MSWVTDYYYKAIFAAYSTGFQTRFASAKSRFQHKCNMGFTFGHFFFFIIPFVTWNMSSTPEIPQVRGHILGGSTPPLLPHPLA